MHSTEKLIIDLSKKLSDKKWKLVTAESCTGGGLSFALTNLAGSSNWFERGFVTYSNNAKEECLGVNPKTLETFGAVSEETAREMAEGALKHGKAEISIAITGIAGPNGGSKEKPVGTVWFGVATINAPTKTFLNIFSGDRLHIREQAIQTALQHILNYFF